MATITIEIGKKGKKKERAVSFLVCQGKTKKRIPTEITVADSELTSNGKRIKEPKKAKLISNMLQTLRIRKSITDCLIDQLYEESLFSGNCQHRIKPDIITDRL